MPFSSTTFYDIIFCWWVIVIILVTSDQNYQQAIKRKATSFEEVKFNLFFILEFKSYPR